MSDPSSSAFFQHMAARVNKYSRLMRKAEVDASLLEAYWDAIWGAAEQAAFAWYASSSWSSDTTRGARQLDSCCTSPPSLPPRAPSPAGGVPATAITRQNNSIAPRLKVIVIPKFLSVSITRDAVAAASVSAFELSGLQPKQQRCATPPSVGRNAGLRNAVLLPPSSTSSSSLPAAIVDVAREFQSSFGVAQSCTSTYHLDGIPQRISELSHREIFALLLRDSRSRQLQGTPSAGAAITADDMASFGRMLADTVGTLGGKGGSGAAAGVLGSTPSCRLRCGQFGELRVGRGVVDFVVSPALVGGGGGGAWASVPRGGVSNRRLGSASLSRLDDVPLPLQFNASNWKNGQPDAPQSRPLSSSSVVVTAVAGRENGDDQSLSSPVAAPELRKYQQPVQRNSRPQSRDSQSSTPLQFGARLLPAAAHPASIEASVPPDDRSAFLALVGARPSSSCSSLGPSASARGGGAGSNSRVGSTRPDESPHHHQRTNDHTQQRRNWKPEHRRHHLDDELAQIQRALETRLGIAVGPSAASATSTSRLSAHGRRSATGSEDLGTDDEEDFNVTQRSATALAYYAAAADETRRPPLTKREVVMHQAIERHRKEMKLRELDDARIAAQRGSNDEMSVFARVQSELLRQEEAKQLMEQLKTQQQGRRDARGKFIADAETCIMRPVDVKPFANPAPGGVVASVSGLGSNPDAVVQEKRQLREKRKAYHAELDTQQSACLRDREAKMAEKQAKEAERLAVHREAVKMEKEEALMKKRSYRTHFTEAWDLQRSIASPSPM